MANLLLSIRSRESQVAPRDHSGDEENAENTRPMQCLHSGPLCNLCRSMLPTLLFTRFHNHFVLVTWHRLFPSVLDRKMLIGYAVKNPRTIPTCIMNQKIASVGLRCGLANNT